jgi:hypothetical protein
LSWQHASWALRLVGLLVFPALLIFNRDILRDAVDVVQDARPAYLVAATLLMLGASVLRAARWRILARAAGVHYQRFADYLSIYYAGLFLGVAVPQIAASFAPVVLMSEDGVSWRRGSVSILFDRLCETVAILVVALVAALYLLPRYTSASALVLAISAGGLMAIALAFLLAPRAPSFLAGRAGWIARTAGSLAETPDSPEAHEIYAGIRRRAPALAVLSALIVGVQVTVVMLLAESLRIEASPMFLASAAAMVVLVVMVPISFAGLGSREGMLVLLFTAAGKPGEEAVALGVLLFAVGIVARLPGIVGWLRQSRTPAVAAAPGDPALPQH